MIFHVMLTKAEDAWIVAECPALPGCVSQGKDEPEALANIREAIAAWFWAEDQKGANVMRRYSYLFSILFTKLMRVLSKRVGPLRLYRRG